jgi:uncharacterized C2H2 Zn-finger protein
MLLRCPRCSELRFFGRTQVLGELVVCPNCDSVFGWRDLSTPRPVHDATPEPGKNNTPES